MRQHENHPAIFCKASNADLDDGSSSKARLYAATAWRGRKRRIGRKKGKRRKGRIGREEGKREKGRIGREKGKGSELDVRWYQYQEGICWLDLQ
ncbi:MAG: hypothetical protein FRX49_01271 [Trebouxia sp. A1-2]|nr:MAG: hypothetical protein FRX49_01271 [Trebouxia sp. A1-2]